VVKANGYGHGLERAMRGFADADGLALIEVDNAVRCANWAGRSPSCCWKVSSVRRTCTPWPARPAGGRALQRATGLAGAAAPQLARAASADLHLKMNTGMNRLGFMPEAFAPPMRA
jgi:alanine racemase